MKTTTAAYTFTGVLLLIAWIVAEVSAGTVAEKENGYAALVYLLGFGFFVIATVGYLIRLKRPPVVGLVCGALGIGLCLFGILPGGDGVVEQVSAPDGTEMMLTQEHNGEPYAVGFYYRKAGGDWGWFYYEHEDTRWLRGIRHIRLSADHRQATIHRLFWPVATFDLEQETFTILRWGRTSKAQHWMPRDWSPSAAGANLAVR